MANHSILVRDDGQAIAFGDNRQKQCCVPILPDGVRYISGAVGMCHSLLLRSDGQVTAFGYNGSGRCNVPELPQGMRYIAAAAGAKHSILVRDDGQAFAFGDNSCKQIVVPTPPTNSHYVAAAAGLYHSILVRDDGKAVAFGINDQDQCNVPQPPEGTNYVAVASGVLHTILLRDDGKAVAFGLNDFGQCDVPELPDKAICVAAAADKFTSSLVLDSGEVVVFGRNDDGPSVVRHLPGGKRCIDAIAGMTHRVYVLSDGQAIAEGSNWYEQCMIPELPEGTCYIVSSACQPQKPFLIITLTGVLQDDSMLEVKCTNMSGAMILQLCMDPARELLMGLRTTLAKKLGVPVSTLRLVTLDGQLLAATDNLRPLAAMFGPFGARKVSDFEKTVRITCLEVGRNSVSNTFHLVLPFDARGRTLYQKLAADIPPSARILAGTWSNIENVRAVEEVQDDDFVPDEITITAFRGKITHTMVLTREQCMQVQQMLMEVLQTPQMQHKLDEFERASNGKWSQYHMRLNLVLRGEVYPVIAASFGLYGKEAGMLPFGAITHHAGHFPGDIEMLQRGLWLEVLMRNHEAQAGIRHTLHVNLEHAKTLEKQAASC